MATSPMSKVIQHLRRAALRHGGAGLTDGQLLGCVVEHRDEAAFAALVRRHGPMVWSVCRRLLNHHDAEDAFQATFLVLFRKATSIQPREMVANWLYGVAHQAALEARRKAARRQRRERQVPEVPEPAAAQPDLWPGLQPLLDQELSRLPDKYRVVILLCDLEGKTRREAAQQLGCPEGTVAGRLARARAMLAKRLARHGLAVSGGSLAAVLSQQAAPACVPAAVVASTIKAATLFAAGQAAASGAIPPTVAALAEGVLKAMLLTKLKSVTAVLLVVATATLTAGALMSRGRATEPAEVVADGREHRRTNPDELHKRVAELKQQLQHMQKEIDQLERETLPRPDERNPRDAFPANRFKYRIPFKTGYTETKEGGRIEIQEVWGTRPRIEVGGQYLVRGKYVLPPGERGTLYFYETADGAWGLTPTADLDLQRIDVDKERGEFALMHGMAGPGYFHLHLTAREHYSRTFANVYFGTGDNVWRKKP